MNERVRGILKHAAHQARGVSWRWAAAAGLAWLALTLAHELAVRFVASLLSWVTNWEWVRSAAALLPGDALHIQLALQMIGDVEARRLALRIPGGDALASALPDLFTPAALAPGDAWVSAVFVAGSSAVGVHMTRLLVNVAFVALGTGLVLDRLRRRRNEAFDGWPRRERAEFGLGALLQAYGAVSLLHLAWSEGSGGRIMLSMVATKVLGLDGAGYDRLASGTAGALLSLGINLSILTVIAGAALALQRLLRAYPAGAPWGRAALLLALPTALPGPAPLALALALYQTPLKASPCYEAPARAQQGAAALVAVTADEGPSAPAANLAPAPALPPRPSVVAVERLPDGFAYQVNGARQWIRGIGYNPVLATGDREVRGERYDRDFAAIQEFGANTLVGWDQKQFDEVLLNEAERHHLGVILPFELSPAWPYSHPMFRQGLLDLIDAWAVRYRDHPALRMWGLGNEVVHGIKDVNSPRASAFARFLVDAADLVRRRDPNHPVIYRDAEDVYLAPVARALSGDSVARPWFVYGMNFFTYRLRNALTDGPAVRLGHPLFISEFGPAGLRAADRPAGYVKLWGIIRDVPQRVLGGAAYVWTTDGPEPLDRSFGLTDAAGAPADGSLAALGAIYQKDHRAERAARGSVATLSLTTPERRAESALK